MSDTIKHECGIALIRLLKPLEYYKEKYGSAFYGVNKMYLMLEKQHNRGQDGAGVASIKLNMQPGERYISRIRSNEAQPVQDIFTRINQRINEGFKANRALKDNVALQKRELPYIGEVIMGHVRYGTFGKNSIENVHPFLRENNWIYRNLIMAGNFNMTNVNELFDNLVHLGQHPKDKTDTVIVMEGIGHFLDDEVEKLYLQLKEEGYTKQEASPFIAERLNIERILKRAAKYWDGGYAMEGMIGNGDAFVRRVLCRKDDAVQYAVLYEHVPAAQRFSRALLCRDPIAFDGVASFIRSVDRNISVEGGRIVIRIDMLGITGRRFVVIVRVGRRCVQQSGAAYRDEDGGSFFCMHKNLLVQYTPSRQKNNLRSADTARDISASAIPEFYTFRFPERRSQRPRAARAFRPFSPKAQSFLSLLPLQRPPHR